MLSVKAIKEYQDIYLKEFGRKLSFEEANEQALTLIRFYKMVLGRVSNNGQTDSLPNSKPKGEE